MIAAILKSGGAIGGVIRIGGAFIGGAYLGDIISSKAQEGHIQKVAQPIINRIEATSIKRLCIAVSLITIITQCTLETYLENVPQKGINRPLALIGTALGTYNISIPFLLGTLLMIQSHKKLSPQGNRSYQLLTHLFIETLKDILGNHYVVLEEAFEYVKKTKRALENFEQYLQIEWKDLNDALEIIFSFQEQQEIADIINKAEEFSEDLKNWNQKIIELEEKLHDYISLAHAQKDSLKETSFEKIEDFEQKLQAVPEEEKKRLTFFYQTFGKREDCFADIQGQIEELRTLKSQIEQLFLKAEHLVEAVTLIAQLNHTEMDAFESWDGAARDMEVGRASQIFTSTADIITWTKRGRRNAQNKEERIDDIAGNNSYFIASKRRVLESTVPQTWKAFTEALTQIHTLRMDIQKELKLIHFSKRALNIQKPFFPLIHQETQATLHKLQGVQDVFTSLKLSDPEKRRQIEQERDLFYRTYEHAAPLRDSGFMKLVNLYRSYTGTPE